MPKEKSGGSQVNYNSSSGSWMYVQYFAVSIKLLLRYTNALFCSHFQLCNQCASVFVQTNGPWDEAITPIARSVLHGCMQHGIVANGGIWLNPWSKHNYSSLPPTLTEIQHVFSTTTTNWNWSCRKDKYQSYFFHYYFGKLLLMCSWVREAIFQFYCNKHESSMFCYFLLSNQTSRQRHNLNMGPGKYTAGRCWGDTWCTTPVWSDSEGKMTQWESVHFQSAFMYL